MPSAQREFSRNGVSRRHSGLDPATTATIVIAVCAVISVLYFGRTLFIPITLAVILALALAPIVRTLTLVRIPRSVASAIVLLSVGIVLAFLVERLLEPAAEWFARIPEAAYRARWVFHGTIGAIENVKEVTKDVSELSKNDDGATRVVVEGPNLTEIFLTNTGEVLATTAVTVVLLFFFLANGDFFLRKTVLILPRLSDKKRIVAIGRQLQVEISRYLLTITAINVVLGLLTALAMYLYSVPNPILWGVIAATFNFAPYVGLIFTTSFIFLASLLTFDTPVEIFLPAATFLVLTGLEGQFITPLVVGRRLTLNPVIVFVCLLAWGWLWGIAGILLAVPLLVTFKILCDHFESLQVFGEYLGSQSAEVDNEYKRQG